MSPDACAILMVTSFPIPGEYDGTAMLPIKIMRALKPRGVDVVLAYLAGPAAVGSGHRPERIRGDAALRAFRLRAGPAARDCRRIAREQPFDLVHAQHYGGATRAYFGVPALWLADGLRDPLAPGRRGRARQPGPRARLQHIPGARKASPAPRRGGHRPGRAGQTGRGRARRACPPNGSA